MDTKATTEKEIFGRMDPRWTARIYTMRTGEDFLGLYAIQANITQYLMPGIITTTSRARYYAFYCWLIVDYAEHHPEGWSLGTFMRRREAIFALANIAHTGSASDKPDVGGLTGSRKLGGHLYGYRQEEVIPLDADPVKNYVQAYWGGYDDYAGAMRSLELVRVADGPGYVLDVLPRGQALANAFATSIQDTEYYRRRREHDTASSIPLCALVEYGSKCHVSYLEHSPDCQPTIEALFALDTSDLLPPHGSGRSTRGNMKGTLGMILEMMDQAQGALEDNDFREAVTYGLCPDYERYRPSPVFKPFLAHWRMFQLREYYTYTLYALWCHFLWWLRTNGPQTLQAFYDHLSEKVDLVNACAVIGIPLARGQGSGWSLGAWMEALLDAAAVPPGDWASRCRAFAQQSRSPLNEHTLYQLLRNQDNDASTHISLAWLLLSTLYLRLCGLQQKEQEGAWYWAQFGEVRRRPLALFVQDTSARVAAGDTILGCLSWLYRDYIVAQHTLVALEKWQERQVNVFHFDYEQGVFEWIQDDWAGFTASRFPQARGMLMDLGLLELDPQQENRLVLTSRGAQTLRRILESSHAGT